MLWYVRTCLRRIEIGSKAVPRFRLTFCCIFLLLSFPKIYTFMGFPLFISKLWIHCLQAVQRVFSWFLLFFQEMLNYSLKPSFEYQVSQNWYSITWQSYFPQRNKHFPRFPGQSFWTDWTLTYLGCSFRRMTLGSISMLPAPESKNRGGEDLSRR